MLEKQAVEELASSFGIPKDKDLVAETQKHWLRKKGSERWEINELAREDQEKVFKWADRQGLLSSQFPRAPSYDTAFILGSTIPEMQRRLQFLKQIWENGVRFCHIVWLTGERSLDPAIEPWTDRCTTEFEAAQVLWEETPLPEAMRQCSLVFINANKRLNLPRATTEDTLKAYLQTTAAEPDTALFVSSQPFCDYQLSVIRTVFSKNCQLDVVGPAMEPDRPLAAAIILDTVARWLYQESVRQEKNSGLHSD